MSTKCHSTLHWFKKGLRLHDNPALLEALQSSNKLWPVYILDPDLVVNGNIGFNRWRFLLQSLQDLDNSLKKFNSRLFVVQENPLEVLPKLFKKWQITQLTYEVETEPPALDRDNKVCKIAKDAGVSVLKRVSHSLYDLDSIVEANDGKPPLTLRGLQSVISKIGHPEKPLPAVTEEDFKDCITGGEDQALYTVPTLQDLNLTSGEEIKLLFPGGESEALKRLERSLKDENWINKFEKPNTSPNSLEPSTTVLSPYLMFGCLSVRLFYHKLQDIYSRAKKHSEPPVSLHGQLLWREFFFCAAYKTPNFNQMKGNPVCLQVDWDSNPEYLAAWTEGRTGYPFIDAIMTQLKQEGWIHHLARHAVACFLTRGDLWINWEEGLKVFEKYLLDHDWSLNAGNWMWLSASAFFHAYYRVYSPVAFGKKTDKSGDYIKKYLPVLKKFPTKYIYEPWKAPLSIQKAASCIIGEDYPKPIVDHAIVRKSNIEKMAKARQAKPRVEGDEDLDGDDTDSDENQDGDNTESGEKRQSSTSDKSGEKKRKLSQTTLLL